MTKYVSLLHLPLHEISTRTLNNNHHHLSTLRARQWGAPAPCSQVTLSHLALGHSVLGDPHALVLCQWGGAEAVLTCWHNILPGLDSA